MYPEISLGSRIGCRNFASVAQNQLRDILKQQLKDIENAGTYKTERVITSAQKTSINVAGSDSPVLNFCANNYLGLSVSEQPKRNFFLQKTPIIHPDFLVQQGHNILLEKDSREIRRRCKFCPIHMRHSGHPQRARKEDQSIPSERRYNPICFLL